MCLVVVVVVAAVIVVVVLVFLSVYCICVQCLKNKLTLMFPLMLAFRVSGQLCIVDRY